MGGRYSEGLGDVSPANENLGRPIPKMFEWDVEEKRNGPKRKDGENQSHWRLN